MRCHFSKLLISLLLTFAALVVFWQLADHEFVNFDDELYVTRNSHVQAGLTYQGLVWALTTTHVGNWHPLTWLSHMLDCELYGLNPGGHHFTSLLLHIANTLLLFVVLKRMTGALRRSVFVAALFALHPLHVESVAWVAERKDVLSTFFWILTMGVYVRYVERPGLNGYLLVLLSFALGLMAKPMLVTLPFVLLLLDYWPLGRFQFGQSSDDSNSQSHESINFSNQRSLIFRLVLEKAPFFALAAVSGVVTFLVQQGGGAVCSLDVLTLDIRVANAMVSYVSYMEKMIWPHHLAVFYPHPGSSLPMWQAAGAGLLLLSVSGLVVRAARRYPYLLTGWLWYLGTLVPVIGLVQVGGHAMSDRYTYVPLIGLFIIMAWSVPDLLSRWRYRNIGLALAAGALLSAFMICTTVQVRHWQNSVALFEHTLDVTANNWLAHNNMGIALARRGKFDEAIAHYSETLRIKPNYARAYNNRGIVLAVQGKTAQAIAHFREALTLTLHKF